MKVIWGERKQEYFFKRDWTTQITLIRLDKLGFARKSAARAGKARGSDQANGSAQRDATCDTLGEGATGQLSALSP